MSGTFISFPKTYELDDCYFGLLARFIRYEFLNNSGMYVQQRGLKQFVSDLEKFHWYVASETSISFRHYCGSEKTYPDFILCLERVRDRLLGFGADIPIEWKEKLKVTPEDLNVPVQLPTSRVIYWLDCFRLAVDEYKPNINIMTFPFPPEQI